MKNFIFIFSLLCFSLGLNASVSAEKESDIIIKANWGGINMECLDFNGNVGYALGEGDVSFTIIFLNENQLTVPIYLYVSLQNEFRKGSKDNLLTARIEIPLTPTEIIECSTTLYEYSIEVPYSYGGSTGPTSNKLKKFHYSFFLETADQTPYPNIGFRKYWNPCEVAATLGYSHSKYFCSYSPYTGSRAGSPMDCNGKTHKTSQMKDAVREINNLVLANDWNEKAAIEGEFLISPNPFNGYFDISYSDINDPIKNIKLLDINGKVIYNSKIFDTFSTTLKHKIDVFDISNGIYFCQIRTANRMIVQKLIKQ